MFFFFLKPYTLSHSSKLVKINSTSGTVYLVFDRINIKHDSLSESKTETRATQPLHYIITRREYVCAAVNIRSTIEKFPEFIYWKKTVFLITRLIIGIKSIRNLLSVGRF